MRIILLSVAYVILFFSSQNGHYNVSLEYVLFPLGDEMTTSTLPTATALPTTNNKKLLVVSDIHNQFTTLELLLEPPL